MGENKKYVYLFEEGRADMKDLLGGKGAGLAEMTNIGLSVPPGLTITTEACIEFYKNGKQFPAGMEEQLAEKFQIVQDRLGKKFGDPNNPLLVSVRSGAPVSMPGMMDTILNLGLNDETVKGFAAQTNNERFALDCYRRFIQMFSDVVLKVDRDKFEHVLERFKEKQGVQIDADLSVDSLQKIVEEFKQVVRNSTGQDFPQDTQQQLLMAVHAVFNSWDNDKAILYRKINKIPDDLGTAPLRPAGENTAPVRTTAGGNWNAHLFVALDARWVLHDITLDGNTFKSSHSVDKRSLVADVGYGVAITQGNWRISIARYHRTREFRGQNEIPVYGTITVGRKF